MRRWRFDGGLGKTYSLLNTMRSRGGSWSRTAKHHKSVHLRCAVCGSVGPLETDHIVPLHRGGSDDWSNLQSLCIEHHREKTARERAE